MTLSLHKVSAIIEMKLKAIIFNKNLVMMPIFSILMTVVYRFLYASILKDNESADTLMGLVLNLGLMLNIVMTGLVVTSSALAEEKEKHTLRTLMTSSVNGLEFFFGSIIPPLGLIIVVNMMLPFLSGISLEVINFPVYFLITTVASITSCVLGMIIGIFAKNQMSANTISTPVMMVLVFIPMFASFSEGLARVSGFLYTGVLTEMITCYSNHQEFELNAPNMTVLFGQIIAAFILFIVIYKRNGYETD